MFTVMIGDFNFTDDTCILKRIDRQLTFETNDEACKAGEDALDKGFMSYVVLPTYQGIIEFATK